jgi:site-specific DNA recombinase
MIAAMAHWEREEIADRVNASVAIRAKLGKQLSGVAPFGYQWKEKKMVIEEKEAPVRRKAYELFGAHRRKGLVARLLNEAGYRTRVGAKWSDIAIGRILRCPSAKGVYCINRMRQTGNWQWEIKPESEWGVIQVEPIVSEQLWTQCNQILEEQHKTNRRPGKKPVQLFGGLAFCACGHKMYVRSNSPKYVCTKCHNKIPVVDLEAIFHEELKVFFANPEQIAKHLQNAGESVKDKERLLQTHRNEIRKVREDMERTHRLYLDGNVTGPGFGQFYKPAEARLNQLLEELPRLEAELTHLNVSNLSAQEVVSEAEKLYSRWPTLPPDRKRSIAESIVERVTIVKYEIHLTLSYLPCSEEMTKSQQELLRR